jgi:hypothetical protein
LRPLVGMDATIECDTCRAQTHDQLWDTVAIAVAIGGAGAYDVAVFPQRAQHPSRQRIGRGAEERAEAVGF